MKQETIDTKAVPKANWYEQPIVLGPSTFTVEHERKPLLYLPNGKVLVKRAGF